MPECVLTFDEEGDVVLEEESPTRLSLLLYRSDFVLSCLDFS